MPLSRFIHACRARFGAKAVTCLALVAVADYVFYGHEAGWISAWVYVLLLGGMLLHNAGILQAPSATVLVFALTGLALSPVLDGNSLVCPMFAGLSTALVLIPRLPPIHDSRQLACDVLRYGVRSPARLGDVLRVIRIIRRRPRDPSRFLGMAILCAVPLILSWLFIMLFSLANPIIGDAMDDIDWLKPLEILSLHRLMVWLVMAAAFWALLRPRYRRSRRSPARAFAAAGRASMVAVLFDRRSVLLSLVVFNTLFLVENLLDAAFLWSGADLPAGMTYAQYAHRGAYPLMAVALLAGGFVLTVLKPGGSLERNPAIRGWVYAWLVQTVFLTVSSLLRLHGYVAEYCLTCLRVAAFIWMGLVATGLVLIMARMALGKGSLWLVNANALVLAATLYACCFASFGGLIAQYNVEHCAEAGGGGAALDVYYLYRIGEDSLPAMHWLHKHHATPLPPLLPNFENDLKTDLHDELADWRQWNIHRARLARRLGDSP